MNGARPEVVTLGNGITEKDLLVHDEHNPSLAFMLGNFEPPMPTPVGIFYEETRETYDGAVNRQLAEAVAKLGAGDLRKLIERGDTWTVN
jgi:hypothetical protein